MRDDLPSVTAAFVAFARGVASTRPMTRPPLVDEAARALLPAPFAWLMPKPGAGRLSQGLLRLASVGLVDQMALRTAAIDEALIEAVEDGVTQVILLGAGLDARAYRLDALAKTRVFEVDHPATQGFKRRRLGGLAPRARELVHVAVDFARGSLAEELARAGHDASAPSFWIWEGVTMYLPREATQATLAVVGERSCAGSGLAVTYMRTERAPLPSRLHSAASAALGLVGEPLRGSFEPDELAALLGQAGFAVRSDENSLDWARRFGGNRLAPVVFRGEHLAVARKG